MSSLISSKMEINMPFIDDFHIHLRQDEMMKFVTSHIYSGGSSRVLVMPNLTPPITRVDDALSYKKSLEKIEPKVTFLMTLYLTKNLTEDEINKAARHGIIGVKYYPKGVTTLSDWGVSDLIKEISPSVFKALSDNGMTLHLHGEVSISNEAPFYQNTDSVSTNVSSSSSYFSSCFCSKNFSNEELNSSTFSATPVSVLEAEEAFLPTLVSLHKLYPSLKIVLEHVTTEHAINIVRNCGPTVAATITLHHLVLTVDDVLGSPFAFCKPVAKWKTDRNALWQVIKEGHPRFFFGSDSAPHHLQKKQSYMHSPPAGIYTSRYLLPAMAQIFEENDCLDKLIPFTCYFGSRFFGLPKKDEHLHHQPTLKLIKKDPWQIPYLLSNNADDDNDSIHIVPFLAGKSVTWSIV